MLLLQELELALVKLINNRLYLDYNATAPLATSVSNWIASGALPFGNPSSLHTSGKISKRHINETTEFLKDMFGLSHFDILYHSGATEGINDIVKGFCIKNFSDKSKFHFVSFKTDHSCVVNQKKFVELLGGEFHSLDVTPDGDFLFEETLSYIKKLDGNILVNYTYINNETGVIWELSEIEKIKKETGCLVHVDAVQMIGKIPCNSFLLSKELDFYTFSGHKFGALKGVGFTFVKDRMKYFSALIQGGGQQSKMRSGTENVTGIYSLKLALEEVKSVCCSENLGSTKTFIENKLVEKFQDKIVIVSKNAKRRNLNTIYLIFEGSRTDTMLMAFDMAQVDISSGSACSSGAVEPSRVLLAMGYTADQARSSLRISLSPCTKMSDSQIIFEKLDTILTRFNK